MEIHRHRWEALGDGLPPPWVARCKQCGLIRFRAGSRALTSYHDVHGGRRYLLGHTAPRCPPLSRSLPPQKPPPAYSFYGVGASGVAHIVESTHAAVTFRCGFAGAVLSFRLESDCPCTVCSADQSSPAHSY